MQTIDRRTNVATTALITEALKFQRAFGKDTALAFLSLRGMHEPHAQRALSEKYDKRQHVSL